MPTSRPSEHQNEILDQFTRQATPFATAPGIRDEAALRLIVEASGAGPDDTVLDITPAMLDRARAHAAQLGLTNVTWRQGDVLPLPWPDASFSIVTSRFAFHHFLDPLAVLREMKRIAKPSGRVVVVDSTPEAKRADAFNRMERLRDPSHVRSLPVDEHRQLFATVGLPEPRVTSYRLEGEMEALIGRSFPHPGDDQKIREIFRAALTDDALDVQPRLEEGQIRYGFPVSVLVADR